MHAVSEGGREAAERNRPRILMVSLGIVLFVVGFVLTIAAIPQDNPSGSSHQANLSGDEGRSGQSNEFFLITGMFVSLTGVVLATVGPAVGFMRKTSKN